MIKPIFVLGAVAFIASCGGRPPPPAISDISNADSLVRVQAQKHVWGEWPSKSAITAEGEHGCQQFKKPAILLSSRCVKMSADDWWLAECVVMEYLFACKIKGEEVTMDETPED